jgi:quercetin dioxygenase-like cupin family protein
MKKKALVIGAALLAFTVVGGAASLGGKAGDAPEEKASGTGKVDRAMEQGQRAITRKVEFENDRMVVIRFRFGPHAKIPLHAAPDLVAVWLSDAHLKLTFPDGASKVEDHKAGDVEWEPAQRHSGENLADKPLDFISIQLKDGWVPPKTTGE